MSFRDLIRRHQRHLLTSTVQVEVAVASYAASAGTSTVTSQTTYTVRCSEMGQLRRSYRPDSTAPQAEAFVVIPVPEDGLPFTPAIGQTVIDQDEMRWLVTAARPTRVDGRLVSFRLELAAGGVV